MLLRYIFFPWFGKLMWMFACTKWLLDIVLLSLQSHPIRWSFWSLLCIASYKQISMLQYGYAILFTGFQMVWCPIYSRVLATSNIFAIAAYLLCIAIAYYPSSLLFEFVSFRLPIFIWLYVYNHHMDQQNTTLHNSVNMCTCRLP
jgi:hypothetical protein